MREYEIRILKAGNATSLVLIGRYFGDHAAIRHARNIAAGRPFEVWCGLDCLYETLRGDRRAASVSGR